MRAWLELVPGYVSRIPLHWQGWKIQSAALDVCQRRTHLLKNAAQDWCGRGKVHPDPSCTCTAALPALGQHHRGMFGKGGPRQMFGHQPGEHEPLPAQAGKDALQQRQPLAVCRRIGHHNQRHGPRVRRNRPLPATEQSLPRRKK